MVKKNERTRIFSALEVANICGVVNQTAINWIKNKYLKAFTTPGGQYRVYADDLLAFLEERKMRIPPEYESILREGMRESSILVIDDDRDFNNALVSHLKSRFPDFTFYTAYDGFEAGASLQRVRPTVVVLDLNLPGVDGITICRNIKQDEQLGKPIVIAISGYDSPRDRDAVLEAGAEGYFAKPIDMDDLAAAIESCLVRR